jgi:hypothetical protein
MRILAKFIQQGTSPGSTCDACGLEVESWNNFYASVFRDQADTRWIVLCACCTPIHGNFEEARHGYHNLVLRPRAA